MSDQPPRNDPSEDPTRMFDATRPEEKLPLPERMPRRGYEGQRRMSPPPAQTTGSYPPPGSPPPAAPPPAPSRYSGGQRPAEAPAVQHVPRAPRSKKDSGLYLPWWSLVVLILVVGGGALLLLMIVLNAGENFILGDQTPQVIVVTNALTGNTVGQHANPTNAQAPGSVPPTAQPISTAVPTAQPTQTGIPGVSTGCPIGLVVEVVGTAPTGLSIRSEPQQGQNILSVAPDGEQFTIVAGPQVSVAVDGTSLEFCQVEGITNTNRQGWAARQYLAEVTQ
ncbi:MAG: SH3 domain-containing protein [Chloroflexi bacterium]|nr:SH3 domain-containing protein [Chloroflexota bacterium]